MKNCRWTFWIYAVKSMFVSWCINIDLAPVKLKNQFQFVHEVSTRVTRSSVENKLYIKIPRLELVKKSFAYRGVILWNSLPSHVRSAPTLDIFKACLDDYFREPFGPLRSAQVYSADQCTCPKDSGLYQHNERYYAGTSSNILPLDYCPPFCYYRLSLYVYGMYLYIQVSVLEFSLLSLSLLKPHSAPFFYKLHFFVSIGKICMWLTKRNKVDLI